MIKEMKKWQKYGIGVLLIVAILATIFMTFRYGTMQASAMGNSLSGVSKKDPFNTHTSGGGKEKYNTRRFPAVIITLDEHGGLGVPSTGGFDAELEHYTGWLPTIASSNTCITIIPYELSTIIWAGDKEEVQLGWYYPGDSAFSIADPGTEWNKTVINGGGEVKNGGMGYGNITTDPTGGAGIFRQALMDKIASEGMTGLANGGWKSLVGPDSKVASTKLWLYFTHDLNNIPPGTLIAQYEGVADLDTNNIASWSKEEVQRGFIGYLDLMMTCYSLTYQAPKARANWENAINEYISEGIKSGTTDCNVNIVLFPGMVNTTEIDGQKDQYVVTSCMDFWNFAYQVVENYSLSNKALAQSMPEAKIVNIFERLKVVTGANLNALSSGVQLPQTSDYCSAGINMAFKQNFGRLPGGGYGWRGPGSGMTTDYNLINTLALKAGEIAGDYAGLNVIFALPVDGLPPTTQTGKGPLRADFNVIWSGHQTKHIIATGQNVNDAAQLRINMKVPDADKSSWQDILDKNDKFEIMFSVWSEANQGRTTVTTKTKDGQVSQLTPPAFKNAGVDYVSGSDKISVTKDMLKQYLWGYQTYDSLYDAAPNNQVINQGELQTYGYDLQVTVFYGNGTTTQSVSSDRVGFTKAQSESDINRYKVTAYRDEDPTRKVTYYSDPEAFAELKQGTIESHNGGAGNGSLETFEAMAGTPSTETLYFSTGGSEFIVEMELEFVEGEKAERTYHDKFFGTECEFKRTDQFKPMTAKGSSNESGYNTVEDIIKEKFVADANGVDLPNLVDEEVEWYKGFIPGGASSYTVDLQGHKETPLSGPGFDDNRDCASTKVTAQWTGTIANKTAEPANIGTFSAGKAGSPCAGIGATAGSLRKKGTPTTNWDVAPYNKALNEALQWAKAYESTNSDYTAKRVADSDEQTRIWRIGDATIHVSLGGGDDTGSNGTKKDFGKLNGNYNTSNISSHKLNTTDKDILGDGWNWSDGIAGSITPGSNGCGHNCDSKDEDHEHTHECGSFTAWQDLQDNAKASDITYTITVTFDNGTIDGHELCGPCCSHDLPEINDLWKQYSQYDYARINTLRVFKIYRSYVDGMEDITFVDYKDEEDLSHSDKKLAWMHGSLSGKTISASSQANKHNGTDTVVAAISRGDPNVFYNIANELPQYKATSGEKDKFADLPSTAGRIRYSYQANRVDEVYQEEMTQRGNTAYLAAYNADQGTRSNKCDGLCATLSGENPIPSAGNGHQNPGSRKGDTSGKTTDKISGSSITLTRWANGILYNSMRYTDDEFWMTDAKTGVEGTVEKNGKGTLKTAYNDSSMDDIDVQTEEYFRFKHRRNCNNSIYVVSDMVLLQTSSGDQPVMYYCQAPQTRTLQQHFDYKAEDVDPRQGYASTDILKNKFENMWQNNPSAACNWGVNNIGQPEDVHVGSYTGEYVDKSNKFSHTVSSRHFSTVFDRVGNTTSEGILDAGTHHFVSTWDGINKICDAAGTVTQLPDDVRFRTFLGNMPYACKTANGWAEKRMPGWEGGYVGRLDPTDGNYHKDDSTVTPGPQEFYIQSNEIDHTDPLEYITSPCIRWPAKGPNSNNQGLRGAFRMSRVTALRIFTDQIEQNPTNINREYITGDATQTYMLLKDYSYYEDLGIPSTFQHKFAIEDVPEKDFDTDKAIDGMLLEANYSRAHDKINDIIVQNPVSVSNAKLVEAVPDMRFDARTGLEDLRAVTLNEKLAEINGCPGDADLCDFRILDCKYGDDQTLLSWNFEQRNTVNGKEIDTLLNNKKTLVNNVDGKLQINLPEGFEVTDEKLKYKVNHINEDTGMTEVVDAYRSIFGENYKNYLKCFGTRLSIPLKDIGLGAYDPNTKLAVEFDFYMEKYSNPTMVISFYGYDFLIPGADGLATWNTGVGIEKQLDSTSFINNETKMRLEFDFKDATQSKLYLNGALVSADHYSIIKPSSAIDASKIGKYINIGSWNRDNGYPACFYIDNFKIIKLAADRMHNENCYKEVQEHQTAIQYTCYTTDNYEYTDNGRPQVFTAKNDGRYRIEAWGAQGGGDSNQGVGSHAGLGGYSTGYINLKKEDKLIVYPGGSGQASTGTGAEYFWVLPTGCGNYGVSSVYTGGKIETKSGVWRYNNRTGNLENSNESLMGVWATSAPYSGCVNHDFAIAYNGDKDKGGTLIKQLSAGSSSAQVPNIAGLVTKQFDGATWARVVFQNITDINNSSHFFTTSNMLNINTNNLFSCLGRLNEFKSDGKFEFMLNYPGVQEGKYNRWTQTANPLDVKTNSGSRGTQNAPGYTPIHMDWTNNTYARGLEYNGGSCILDGSVDHGNWWLAVGAFQNTNYPIPGPFVNAYSVELWVKVGQSKVPAYENATSAGWNGGGIGGPGGFGGGGASDIRVVHNGGYFDLTNKNNIGNGAMTDNSSLVYGPYTNAVAGHYQADIYGKNLNKCTFDAYANGMSGTNKIIPFTDMRVTPTHVTLYFDVPKDFQADGNGLEVRTHHEGVSGFKFDGLYVTRLEDRVLVAGGGGGADNAGGNIGGSEDGSGGAGGGEIGGSAYISGIQSSREEKAAIENLDSSGCGLGGTQASGGGFGLGESASWITDTGGAGGGWYGGYVTNDKNGGGGGGSGYAGNGVSNATLYSNTRKGDGRIRIRFIEHETDTGISNSFTYTGNVQAYTIPESGEYRVEVWGASGGDGREVNSANVIKNSGGAGGYSRGYKSFSAGQTVYIYVGGAGEANSDRGYQGHGEGGWNGGGNGGYDSDGSDSESGAGGGGMSHVSTSGNDDVSNGKFSVSDVLIAAGGGGGSGSQTAATAYGGPGGGDSGGTFNDFSIPGTQDSGNTVRGRGKDGLSDPGGNDPHYIYGVGTGGGGGGYFGGTWTGPYTPQYGLSDRVGGAGGSGYIGGVSKAYSLSGNNPVPSHDGKTTTIGNRGDGYVKLTKVNHAHDSSCTFESSKYNYHKHIDTCIDVDNPVLLSALNQEYAGNGAQLKNLLGATLYNKLRSNQENVIYTIKDFSDVDYRTVKALYNCTVRPDGSGNLLQENNTTDSMIEFPVNFPAGAITKIQVKCRFDGVDPGYSDLFFKRTTDSTAYVGNRHSRAQIDANGVITFDMTDKKTTNVENWNGTISYIRLDLIGNNSPGGTVVIDEITFLGSGQVNTPASETQKLITFENFSYTSRWGIKDEGSPAPTTFEDGYVVNSGNLNGMEFTLPFKMDNAQDLKFVKIWITNLSGKNVSTGVYWNNTSGGANNCQHLAMSATNTEQVITIPVHASFGELNTLSFDTIAGDNTGTTKIRKIELWGFANQKKAPTQSGSVQTKKYNYTGKFQTFIAPQDGDYVLTLYGASGGGDLNQTVGSHAGLGGKTTGTIYLGKGKGLGIYVGGYGINGASSAVEYGYTGTVQRYVVPKDGIYKLEVWGASGGATTTNPEVGGAGGYSSGNKYLKAGEVLSIYVGGQGAFSSNTSGGGYNGGGAGGTNAYGGGGATDITPTLSYILGKDVSSHSGTSYTISGNNKILHANASVFPSVPASAGHYYRFDYKGSGFTGAKSWDTYSYCNNGAVGKDVNARIVYRNINNNSAQLIVKADVDMRSLECRLYNGSGNITIEEVTVTDLSSRYIVGAGGGGSADGVHGITYAGNYGGNGGGASGENGKIESDDSVNRIPAKGGSQTSGGQGGINKTTYPNNGANGLIGIGGNGVNMQGHAGGGGGGGWYGGGGACGWYQGGGAGGSSYTGAVTNPVTTTGARRGNGLVRITSQVESSGGYNGGGDGWYTSGGSFGGGGATDVVARYAEINAQSTVGSPNNSGATKSGTTWVMPANTGTVHIHTGLGGLVESYQNAIFRIDYEGTNLNSYELVNSVYYDGTWHGGQGFQIIRSKITNSSAQFFVKATTPHPNVAFCYDHKGNNTGTVTKITVSRLDDRIAVAGGGGGADNPGGTVGTGDDGSGGSGGGLSGGFGYTSGAIDTHNAAGTQNSGFAMGVGESSNKGTDNGGGGGGYWGGRQGINGNSGGGGGSGYIGGVRNGSTENGKNTAEGSGSAIITYDTYTSTPAEFTAEDPTNFSARYASTFIGLDGTDAGLLKAAEVIGQNVDEIPTQLNGGTNPIFDCNWRYNQHDCELSDLVNVNGQKIHKCYVITKVLDCHEPHHYGMHYESKTEDHDSCYKPCLDDDRHNVNRQEVFDPATNVPLRDAVYLNTDEYFDVMFPNEGDFYESDIGRKTGIKSTIQTRGVSYEAGSSDMGMETTRWTREKYVKFSFDTLFYRDETSRWEQYKADTWIELPVVGKTYPRYRFYCTLNNSERSAATVEFAVEAINCPGGEGKYNAKNGSYLVNSYSFNSGKHAGTGKAYKYGDYGDHSVETGEKTVGLDRFVVTTNINKNPDLVYKKNAYVGSYDVDNDYIFDESLGKESASNHVNDNDNPREVTNRERSANLKSKHGATKTVYTDLVGRIGNLKITNTDDLRFCNLFKVINPNGGWIIEGIVKEVFPDKQESYLSWHYANGELAKDIRNRLVTKKTGMYDTWGSQVWCGNYSTSAKSVTLPLNSDKNPAKQLKNDLLKPGYNVTYEITTTGNYTGYLQVKPYFYALCIDGKGTNHKTGEIVPVDVYMNTENGYKPINYFGLTDNKTEMAALADNIKDYILDLNWSEENGVRNYEDQERAGNTINIDHIESVITKAVHESYSDFILDDAGNTKQINLVVPGGTYYALGNVQAMQVRGGARTFIGTRNTAIEVFNNNSSDTNFDNLFSDIEYAYRAQRWHLKLGLPSSAVFTIYDGKHRVTPDEDVIVDGHTMKAYEQVQQGNYVILMSANIKSMGQIWNLAYSQPEKNGQSSNGSIRVLDKEYQVGYLGPNNKSEDEFRVLLAVYDAGNTSKVDIDTIKTH